MDSHDSSATPFHHHHHQHHQHHHQHHQQQQQHHQHQHHHFPHQPQQMQPSHHSVMVGQTQQHHPNNSYPLPGTNNSLAPTTSANAAMMHQHNARFPFNSMPAAPPPAAQKQLDHQYPADGSPSGSGGGGGWFNMEPAKKKRGRPRKYSPDNSIGLGLTPAPGNQMSAAIVNPDSGGGGNPSSESGKRNRGRPPGSVKRQLDALGIPGAGFTPHVVIVNSGEDVASKIMAFAQQGPRTVCVLSAHGTICNVTLRQPATSHGTLTHEGRFEIISLSGSFHLSDADATRGRNGGLSVSLAGSDGRVLGGGVAGMLKAASLVQVVVGSFIAEGKKSKTVYSTQASNMLNFGPQGTGVSPRSPGGSSESAGEEHHGSNHLDRGLGPYANPAQQPMQSIPMYNTMGWPNSIKLLPN